MRRIRATYSQWQELRDLLIGPTGTRCWGCGQWRYKLELSLHHVLPRSLGGDDLEENLVPLCGDGTRGCHGTWETRLDGWKAIAGEIRERLELSVKRMDYLAGKRGGPEQARAFLDRYYPVKETAQC